jgi:hypothetical protein
LEKNCIPLSKRDSLVLFFSRTNVVVRPSAHSHTALSPRRYLPSCTLCIYLTMAAELLSPTGVTSHLVSGAVTLSREFQNEPCSHESYVHVHPLLLLQPCLSTCLSTLILVHVLEREKFMYLREKFIPYPLQLQLDLDLDLDLSSRGVSRLLVRLFA